MTAQITLAECWVEGVFSLWWPHLLVWAVGVAYFVGQRGKPKPRLWFDIGWRFTVAITGAMIIGRGLQIHWFPFPWPLFLLWAGGLMCFNYGEGIHWGGNFLNDWVIPAEEDTVPQSVQQATKWLDNTAGHLWPTIGLAAMLLSQVWATILWFR